MTSSVQTVERESGSMEKTMMVGETGGYGQSTTSGMSTTQKREDEEEEEEEEEDFY